MCAVTSFADYSAVFTSTEWFLYEKAERFLGNKCERPNWLKNNQTRTPGRTRRTAKARTVVCFSTPADILSSRLQA